MKCVKRLFGSSFWGCADIYYGKIERQDESQQIGDKNEILCQIDMCAMRLSKQFENKLRFVVLKQTNFPADLMSGVCCLVKLDLLTPSGPWVGSKWPASHIS